MNRVVITGRGAVSPLGVGVANLSSGIRQGRSGVKIMEDWREISGLHSFLAAPVPEINPKEYLPRSVRRTMGNMALHAAIAAREAVDDAGLTPEQLEGGRTGVVIGSTTGSPEIY